jgi:phosphatidylserine/phosphatidylglycerophosphate/cardiolipin synthase-like enzyme
LIGPDHLFEEVRALLDEATVSIDIRVHALDNADLVDAIVARQISGVRVRLLLEQGTTWQPSDVERWAAQQIEQAGGTVFVRQPTGAGSDRPPEHARLVIIDGSKALVGSEDLTDRSMPSDAKSDGTAGRRGVYALVNDSTIAGHLNTTFAEALRPTVSHRAVRWTIPAPPSYQPARASGGSAYHVVRNAPLLVAGPLSIALSGCLECASEHDAFLNLAGRAGPGDTILVEQFRERLVSGSRFETYLAAARRGAAVRVLLDRTDADTGDERGNHATARHLNAIAAEEGLNLEVRLANPTGFRPPSPFR